MLKFPSSQNFINLVKNNTCLRASCMNLILTNRKYSLQNIQSYETDLRDHHHLIYSVMETAFSFEESKS